MTKKLKDIDKNIIFLSPQNVVHPEIAYLLDAKKIGTLTGHLWEQLTLPIYLSTKRNYILLNLCNTAPLFCNHVALVLHDVSYHVNDNNFRKSFSFYYKNLLKNAVPRAKKLFTVSCFSRNEICKIYKIFEPNIQVVYNAPSPIFSTPNNIDHTQKEKIILFVATNNPQKNITAALAAFNELTDNNVYFYIVGSGYDTVMFQEQIHNYKKKDHIVVLGRISDSELASLYAKSTCFVSTSTYEGFGLPIIEAQVAGCPVIASDIAVYNEIAKDSVAYIDPNNIDNIKNGITRMISDEKYRKSLIKKGYENAKRFTWADSANIIYSTLKEK
ncbi:glycosyltransferase family 4 protein [Thalassospira mesophila]|nr:glycosyltransferase family 1 protein [Thalassospira mesophila]